MYGQQQGQRREASGQNASTSGGQHWQQGGGSSAQQQYYNAGGVGPASYQQQHAAGNYYAPYSNYQSYQSYQSYQQQPGACAPVPPYPQYPYDQQYNYYYQAQPHQQYSYPVQGQGQGHGQDQWQYHPVAPLCQQTRPRPKKQQQHKQQQQRQESPSVQQQKFECSSCQRTFKQLVQLNAHLKQHQVCGYQGCTFSAIPKVLKEHREKEHFKPKENSKTKPVCLESEEEVQAYLRERRENYPTAANMKRKLEVANVRKELGQLEPEKMQRRKRLKAILETQKKMGVARIAGTDCMQNTHDSPPKQSSAKDKSPLPSSGGGGKGDEGRRVVNGRKIEKKKEESLVSKLLESSLRKEKSHILQCFRFLVKTRYCNKF